MIAEAGIKARYEALRPWLDERARRLLAAAERKPSIGTLRSRPIWSNCWSPPRAQDPEAPLRWTCKSLRKLTAELQRLHHRVSHQVVADLLHDLGYSLQANRKTHEGASHPDRNAQFEHLNGKVKWCLSHKEPVISVNTKKKELVGDFKNGGRELRPKGDPEKVRVHDFIDPELGRASPYGIYDIGRNSGWVSVGVDHDTAEFAVETIRRCWRSMGQQTYPGGQASADHGGFGGQQRLTAALMERGATKTRR